MKKRLYLGIDIGGTKISGALIDDKGHISARGKLPTPIPSTPKLILERIKKLVRELTKSAGLETGVLAGIGVGVPGVVRPDHETILITPNIGLSHFPLAQRLKKIYKVKVVLGNDVNLGILAESWLGVGKGIKNLIGLFPGTGVGGGIIIDGKMYTGSQGAAGELGHMIIDQDSTIKNAGLFGTLEGLASRQAIEREIRLAVKKGEKSVVTELTGGNLDVIKSRFLRQALEQKDKVVSRIIDQVSATLGRTCISLRHIFNPDMIVLGGGVIEACGDIILPKVQRISAADPFFKGIDDCAIVRSQLGDDATILGAVALLRTVLKVKNSPEISFYPTIKSLRSSGVSIDGKIYKKSFIIRGDGKVKKLDQKQIAATLGGHKRVGTMILQKCCKKNPQVFIIGTLDSKLSLTMDAKHYLKIHSIECKILARSAAIKFYNRLSCRKTILVHQS